MSSEFAAWLVHPVTLGLAAAAVAALFVVIELLLRSLSQLGNVRFQGILEEHPELFSSASTVHVSRLIDVLRWIQLGCLGLFWLLVFRFPGLEFGAAAALEPDNASFARAYALALVRHGRLADGLEAMDMAITLDPTNTDVRFEAAGLHLRSGDFATAVTHLDVYVEARPSDPNGHVRRALALAELGRLDEAQSSIDLARELVAGDESGPDLDEEILLATGRLHEARGDTAAAVRAYEAALAANPVSDEARGRLRALNLPEAE